MKTLALAALACFLFGQVANAQDGQGYLGIRPTTTLATHPIPYGSGQVSGIDIVSIVADGPAARAGLWEADSILTVNGLALQDGADLTRMIRQAGAGTPVRLVLWHQGKITNVDVVLGNVPPAPPAPLVTVTKPSGKIDPDPTSPSYRQGSADRDAWENWFSGLQGARRVGADYWTAQRSLKAPIQCKVTAMQSDALWLAGCLEAQQRLKSSDYLRHTDAQYWNGWNKVVLQVPSQPGQPSVAQTQPSPERVDPAPPATFAPLPPKLVQPDQPKASSNEPLSIRILRTENAGSHTYVLFSVENNTDQSFENTHWSCVFLNNGDPVYEEQSYIENVPSHGHAVQRVIQNYGGPFNKIDCRFLRSRPAYIPAVADTLPPSRNGEPVASEPVSDTDRQSFGPSDETRIIDASRNNELRFARDYKGKLFDGVIPFSSATSGLFGTSYLIHFDSVYCTGISDQAVLDRVINWKTGQRIHVHGVIRDTTLGDIQLQDCVFAL